MRLLLAIPLALAMGACSSVPAPIARDLGISGLPAAKAANVKSRTAAVKANTSVVSASSSASAARTQIEAAKKIVDEPLPEKQAELEVVIDKLRSNLSQASLNLQNVERELETTKAELQIVVSAAGEKDAALAQLEASTKGAEEKYSVAVARNDHLVSENIKVGEERDDAKASKRKWVWQSVGLYAVVIGFVAWKLKALFLFSP